MLAADIHFEKEKGVKVAGYVFLSASVVLFVVTVVAAMYEGIAAAFG